MGKQADDMIKTGIANRAEQGFLEICIDSTASARAAIAGGADRLEVCSTLSLGGLTPSAGLLSAVVALARPAGVSVRAMVRPRAGGFTYDACELEQVIAESALLLRDGADGLVFGALDGDALCKDRLITWRDAVRAMPHGDTAGLTLHRAVDMTADPVAQVAVAIDIGFDQILTSGGANNAIDGIACLSAMVQRAGSACRIVAASGIRPANVAALIAATANRAIHASARQENLSAAQNTDDRFDFGKAALPADAAVVRALRAAIDGSPG